MGSSGWRQAPLGQVLTQVFDEVHVDDGTLYKQVTVRLHGKGAVLRQEIPGSEIKTKRQFRVRTGQFIYSRIDAKYSAIAVIPPELDGAIVSTDFPVFDIRTNLIEPRFLERYVRTPAFLQECADGSSGTTKRTRLKEEKLLQIEIPFPSLDEQRRIVARIEALAGRIGEALSLQQDARNESDVLLNTSLYSIFSPDATKGWKETPLEAISKIVSGVTLGRKMQGTTITAPYLRVANVQDGWLDLSEIKLVAIRPYELEKWRLQPGDLVLTEGGDIDKLGRGTVWRGEIFDCIHQNHIFRVRLIQDYISPDFLNLEIRSPYGKDYFLSKAKRTTNLASINQTQLRAFPVRYPDKDTQQEIVCEVQKLEQRINRLKVEQSNSEVILDALLPAVLDKAFRGEL